MPDDLFIWTVAKNIGGGAVAVAGVGFVGYVAVQIAYNLYCFAIDRIRKARHIQKALVHVLMAGATDETMKAAAEGIAEARKRNATAATERNDES